MSYEDFAAETSHHIYLKWKQYDPKQPLIPWVSRIIHRQFTNYLRNNYFRIQKPCLRCPLFCKETNYCSFTEGEPSKMCFFYKKWTDNNLDSATDIMLPVTMENHAQEVYDQPTDNFDYQSNKKKFEIELQKNLSELEWRVYTLLFIDNRTEAQAALAMGFKVEKYKKNGGGNKRIRELEAIIVQKSKDLLRDKSIEMDLY